MSTLKIATRKSPLALWQAQHVRDLLKIQYPSLTIEFISLTTTGDQKTEISLNDIGGKSLFVKELQEAILDHRADIAVHSVKDMSAHPTPHLILPAVLKREDPRDALISFTYASLADLPTGAVVGTSSPRRECQLRVYRSDLHIQLLRGNVETRLKKAQQGEYDAIILAVAGLKRLGLEKYITEIFSTDFFIPAIGQGIIGIECRENDENTKRLIASLNDEMTYRCLSAERAVNQTLNGNCFTPLGAFAEIKNDELLLSAMVGTPDGSTLIKEQCIDNTLSPAELGYALAETLLLQGADKVLKDASFSLREKVSRSDG